MKLVSWNVNGFRACLNKGFEDIFKDFDADIFCIQETKMQPDQADFSPELYNKYFFSAIKKGYSGTAVYTKEKPLNVTYGLENKLQESRDKQLADQNQKNAALEKKETDENLKLEKEKQKYVENYKANKRLEKQQQDAYEKANGYTGEKARNFAERYNVALGFYTSSMPEFALTVNSLSVVSFSQRLWL